jgi:uncharacterized protein YrrD
MFWQVSALREFNVQAGGERCGRIVDVLIDDRAWSVRWLVAEVGSWLKSHKVLLPPAAFGKPDEDTQLLPTSWTVDGVIHGRGTDEDPPVAMQMASRAVEAAADRLDTYATMALTTEAHVFPSLAQAAEDLRANRKADPPLRSFAEVVGYDVTERNGAIGTLQDFIVDDDTWAVTHLLIRWSHWWTIHDVLVPVSTVHELRWDDKTVALTVTTSDVRHATPLESIAIHGRGIEPRPSSGWESVM